jgi:predicted PurR-regulated permease PerM
MSTPAPVPPRSTPHDQAWAAARKAAAATAGAGSVALAAVVAWKSAWLIALALAAILLAIPLNRFVRALTRLRIPRGASIAVVVIALLAGFAAAAAYVIRPAAVQLAQLVADMPSLVDALRRSPWVAQLGRSLGDVGLLGKVRESAPAILHDVVRPAVGAVSGVAGGLSAFVGVLLTAILLLASGPSLSTSVLNLVSPERRDRFHGLAVHVEETLGGYLAGLAIVLAARALATGVFLSLLHVPFYLPLSLLAGVSVLVPYLGAIVRFATIVPIAAATRGLGGAAAALVFLVVYDSIESYLLSPLVYRREVSLSPLVQFAAVVFFGYHAGVVGAMLALPLTAALHTVVEELWQWRRARR